MKTILRRKLFYIFVFFYILNGCFGSSKYFEPALTLDQIRRDIQILESNKKPVRWKAFMDSIPDSRPRIDRLKSGGTQKADIKLAGKWRKKNILKKEKIIYTIESEVHFDTMHSVIKSDSKSERLRIYYYKAIQKKLNSREYKAMKTFIDKQYKKFKTDFTKNQIKNNDIALRIYEDVELTKKRAAQHHEWT